MSISTYQVYLLQYLISSTSFLITFIIIINKLIKAFNGVQVVIHASQLEKVYTYVCVHMLLIKN